MVHSRRWINRLTATETHKKTRAFCFRMCNQNKKQQAYLETLPMPISQGRLITCLILSAFSATTWADSILVNTTADKSVDDEFCSLREAVSYINLKNTKKVATDKELAIIAGTSDTLDTTSATAALTAEKAKASPNAIEIARLEDLIKTAQNKYNASLLALNSQLQIQENELKLETGKAVQDATKIKSLNSSIETLKAQIKTQQDATTAKEKELQDYRNKGVNGCKSISNESTDSIKLQTSKTPYEVDNNAIIINVAINISAEVLTTSNNDVSNLETIGTDVNPRTVIKAIGNHALFLIDDGQENDADHNDLTAPKYISVTFTDIDFQGCNNNFCDINGGIFSNKEELIINNSIVSGGRASKFGGAIYNDINAIFVANQLLFQNNQAGDDGAAVYSELTTIFITNSLFTKNTALNGIVTAHNKTFLYHGATTPTISNSTFSGNTGTAISSRSSLTLQSLTIVLNDTGINFNNETPTLFSSIIAANKQDCSNVGAILGDSIILTHAAHNIYQTGCELVSTSVDINTYNPNHKKLASTVKIIADTDINGNNTGGKCAAPPAQGLLCPLSDNGGLTKTHKPRLLIEYKSLSESPIVNKGFSTPTPSLNCPNQDQRGKPRTVCDIGAVELQGLITSTQGQDITSGQKAQFDLVEKIGDGELLPADQCPPLFGSIVGGYIDGCAHLLSFPTKGIVRFDNVNHQVLYNTTEPDFHGFDKFSYLMTTTISRFSDARNDQEVKIDVRVVSDPANSLSSKSLDTGTTSIFSLLMLSLLMVWRRTR